MRLRLPGSKAYVFFAKSFLVKDNTRSEITEDGGQGRYDKARFLLG